MTPNPRVTGFCFHVAEELSTGSRQGCSDPVLREGQIQPSRGGMVDFGVLIILGRRPVILPKVEAQGQRGRERKILELNETTKSLHSSSQHCFLPLSASTPLWATSWNVKWLVVMAGRRGASCREDPGQGASSRRTG